MTMTTMTMSTSNMTTMTNRIRPLVARISCKTMRTLTTMNKMMTTRMSKIVIKEGDYDDE
jgi:hypothetical protein